MKNAEKFKEIFKEFATEVWAFPEKDFLTWLNAEYEEPTTKNDLGVDCISRADAIQAMQDKAKKLTNEDTINGLCGAVAILYEMPSVTPQLSVSEVTALAEWTEKLTKASEDAYNKGYADGMKAQEPRKGHWMLRNSFLVPYKCSECNYKSERYDNYCPNCGAKMVEPQESEG